MTSLTKFILILTFSILFPFQHFLHECCIQPLAKLETHLIKTTNLLKTKLSVKDQAALIPAWYDGYG